MQAVTSLWSSLTTSISIGITFDLQSHQKISEFRVRKGVRQSFPIFTGNDDISGTAKIELQKTDKYEHLGIKCFLIGFLQIYDNQQLSTEFISLSKELEPAGTLSETKSYKFKFNNFEKQYETFFGKAGCITYFIRISIARPYLPALTHQNSFAVLKYLSPTQPLKNEPIKHDIGIQGCVNIQFTLNKSQFHLKDILIGSVLFKSIKKVSIQRMELHLIRKQTCGTGENAKIEKQTLLNYEIMDGAPDQGSVIPIRLYFSGIKSIGPTFANLHNRFSIRHWISLVIFDEDGKKYFKQVEISVYRKA